MKNKITFITIILSLNICHAQIEFYSGNNFKFPLKDGKENFSLKYDSGARLKFRGLTAIWIAGIGTETFHDIASSSFCEFEAMQKYRYGIKYSAATKFAATDFLAGTLRFSQGISRLKQPNFYVPSALKKPSLLAPGISPSLPSWTSGKTPLAAAISISPGNKNSFLPTIQLSVLETKEFYASAFKRFSAPFIPNATISFSGGLFEYGRENSSAWFQKQRFFSTEKRGAAETELNIAFAHFRISGAAGIHESPFGGNFFWARLQNFILLGDFLLHSFYYTADESLITADKTENRIKTQAGINPQYTFWFGKTSVSTGILLYSAERQTIEKFPSAFNEYCAKTALSISSGKCKLSSNAAFIYSTEKNEKEYSAQIKASRNFKSSSTSATFSYKKEDSGKNTFSFTSTVYPKKTMLRQAGIGFSFSEKEGEFKCSPSATTVFKGGNRKIKWNIKTAFLLNF